MKIFAKLYTLKHDRRKITTVMLESFCYATDNDNVSAGLTVLHFGTCRNR